MIFLVILAIIILVAVYFLVGGKLGLQPSGNFTPYITLVNCEDLQISINSIKEAIAYYRFDILIPAPSDYKFEIINLTVTNKGNATKDFSGHRLELLADGATHMAFSFSEIEKITLLDNSTTDYNCRESRFASIYRLELNAGESSTGCKIFRMLKDSEPVSISVYDLEGLKCTIQL